MIATWMVYASLLGLFVSLAAHALDRAARANGLPSRYIWVTAMVVTLITPVAVYATRLASPSASATAIAGLPAPLDVTAGAASVETVSGVTRAIASATAVAAKINRPLALLWIGLTLLLLGRIAFAAAMLWRSRREWIAREIDGTQLYVTDNLGPAVIALPRPEILVPQWLLSLDEANIAMVLRHEREHRAAGDQRLLIASTVLTALVPWNIGLWWQMRRLRLAVEMDCDARVLRVDPRVDRYGSLLLAIAQHPRAALHGAATLTESPSDLERRIDAITRKRPTAPRLLAAALVSAALAAVIVACEMPSPDPLSDPASASASRTGDYLEFQVESPARIPADAGVPKYPEQLRVAGVGGTVVARFVADTNGRVDMVTIQIVRSDHDLLASSVRDWLTEIRLAPARISGGRSVRQWVNMPFTFSTNGIGGNYEKRVRPETAVVSGHRLIAYEPAADEQSANLTSPVGDPGNGIPAYPEQLRRANVEGSVVARFVVRADGTVDLGTVQILRSSHDLFSHAVRTSLATMRFKPRLSGGHAVESIVTMPFTFSLTR